MDLCSVLTLSGWITSKRCTRWNAAHAHLSYSYQGSSSALQRVGRGVELVRNLLAHEQKPHFVFRLNRGVHLNRWGSQFSRLLAAEVCASALVMLDTPRSEGVWEYWLTTPFASFPFTSPPVRIRVPPHSERSIRRITLPRQIQDKSYHIVENCLFINSFLDAFAKLRKAIISYVISVRPSACNNSAPTRRIFMKFNIWGFFGKLSRKLNFH